VQIAQRGVNHFEGVNMSATRNTMSPDLAVHSDELTVRAGSRTRTGACIHMAVRIGGAALALAVAYIHVKDQGGFPGDKAPGYVGAGYYALEAAALMTAIGFIALSGRRLQLMWLLAIGVAAGPLVGFVLSRGPGLPNYTDDKGNWTETLGLISIVVEAVLLVLAVACLARPGRLPAGSD
jgi:hypothetical protein